MVKNHAYLNRCYYWQNIHEYKNVTNTSQLQCTKTLRENTILSNFTYNKYRTAVRAVNLRNSMKIYNSHSSEQRYHKVQNMK